MNGADRPRYDAVVLAGGRARRLGGVDKPAQRLGGRILLDRVLDAVGGAERTVVVGPSRNTSQPVRWVRESPPGSGPVPALGVGLAAVRAPLVAVLAADLPFLSADVIDRLLAAVPAPASPPVRSGAGAVLVDGEGHRQWLAGCWRTEALRRAWASAAPGGPGASLRALMAPLIPAEVAAEYHSGPPPWYDCDTPEDLSRAEAWT